MLIYPEYLQISLIIVEFRIVINSIRKKYYVVLDNFKKEKNY